MLSSQEEQIERMRVFAQDQSLRTGTYLSHTHDDIHQGRFAAMGPAQVVGADPIPNYPAAAPHQRDPVPQEPSLGYSVSDLNPSDPVEPSSFTQQGLGEPMSDDAPSCVGSPPSSSGDPAVVSFASHPATISSTSALSTPPPRDTERSGATTPFACRRTLSVLEQRSKGKGRRPSTMGRYSGTQSTELAARAARDEAMIDLASLLSFPCDYSEMPAKRGNRYRSPWGWGQLTGVPTGALNGFDVLSVEADGFEWLAEHRSRIPRTLTHHTRTGGRHLFFRHSPEVRCSPVVLGVDVHSDGSFVAWWPEKGLPVDDGPLADWPRWLFQVANFDMMLCADCGVETSNEFFMLNHDVWALAVAGENQRGGLFLCVGCLERRLGRRLAPGDFLDCVLNNRTDFPRSQRLRERMLQRWVAEDFSVYGGGRSPEDQKAMAQEFRRRV
jgi:hypothetical protein